VGYKSNPELVASYEALPGFQPMFPHAVTGDGLIMATELGAAVRVIGNNLSVFMQFRNLDDAPPGSTAPCHVSGTQELTSRHTMVVNRYGRRFTDETFFQAAAPSLRVFDVNARAAEPALRPHLRCAICAEPVLRRSQAGCANPPWVASGPTLAAVGDALGIDAPGCLPRWTASTPTPARVSAASSIAAKPRAA
jgi:3-oxosteroid 1-dehydrogenase